MAKTHMHQEPPRNLILEVRDTWITGPKQLWPIHVYDIHEPVVRLARTLYGHPLAGFYWEQH
eukprot:1438630-Karenia_brevis.AAC.1